MESLPKEIVMEIVIKLTVKEILNFCLTSKQYYELILLSETFWRRKLEIDYTDKFLKFYRSGIPVKNCKAKYIRRFNYTNKMINLFVEEFITMSFKRDFVIFLNDKYKKELFVTVSSLYQDFRNKKYQTDDDDEPIREKLNKYYPGDLDSNEYDSLIEHTQYFFDYLIMKDEKRKAKRDLINTLKIKSYYNL